ncbi:MAG TPA: DMT family transporter [Acidimicrobiales bacterium]|nr:DMT family transporter [Acidimicrobiales bacterium]
MAVGASLAAAFLYAAASVLQHRSAAAQPDHRSMRPGLLVSLAGRPAWLAGIAADAGAYAFQFVALAHGSLVLVQPLLVSGLLLALPMGSALTHRRLTRGEWVAAGLVAAGLSTFLLVASPSPGRPDAPLGAWAATLAAGLVAGGAMVAGARRVQGAARACLLAAAGGVATGVAAALTKATAHLLGQGLGAAVSSWKPYLLVAVGALALLAAQSAFQAGPIRWSLPILTVAEALSAIAIGAGTLGESARATPGALGAQALALAAMAAGIFGLGQAPLGAP